MQKKKRAEIFTVSKRRQNKIVDSSRETFSRNYAMETRMDIIE